MTNRVRLKSAFMFSAALVAWSGVARAGESVDAHSPEWVNVSGKAIFEHRSVKVPSKEICRGTELCPQSRRYWGLTVIDGDVKYIVEDSYLVASEAPPSAIEVQGVQVRSGAQLVLSARARKFAPKATILSDLRELREHSFPALTRLMWRCQSAEPGIDGKRHFVEVVRFRFFNPRSYGLDIGVWARDGYQPVARIRNASGELRDGGLRIQGAHGKLAARLTIDQSAKRKQNVPAVLRIRDGLVEPGDRAETVRPEAVPMTCNQGSLVSN